MNEEEIEKIKDLKAVYSGAVQAGELSIANIIKCGIDLIEKLQKENEELKHKYDNALSNLVNAEKENEELKKELGRVTHGRNQLFEYATVQQVNPEMLHKVLRVEYIPKQKIRDKIEEIKNRIDKYREYTELGIETDVEWVDNVADRQTLKTLQDLLESEEK